MNNSSKDYNGGFNCPPGDTCMARKVAQKMVDDGNAMEKVLNSVQEFVGDKANSIKNTVVEDLKKPAKCVTDVAGLIPSIITNTGDAIVGVFDKIGASFENMAGKAANLTMDEDGFPDIFAPFRIVYLSAMKDLQGLVAKIALGKDAPSILADPNMNPDKILEDMKNISESYKKIVDSPKFKSIFNKWITNYAEVIDKTIQQGKPQIDGVTKQLTGIIDETSNKVGDALSNSLQNIVKAVIKSVPGVGAVYSIAELLKKTGEKLLNVCEPAVTKGGVAAFTVANTTVDQLKKASCKLDELKENLAPLLQGSQTGGNRTCRNGLNNRKKIIKATRRLKHMLSKFTKKHKVKINYGSRMNKTRYLKFSR
jgi:hypothetical protein